LTKDVEKELTFYRDEIDKIDEEILHLVNRRIAAAKVIGKIKSTLSQPAFYRPEREAQLLRRLIELNDGPIDNFSVESLFREIMSVTRGIEAELSVSVLGPSGTFTELAAKRHFGSSIEIVPLATIDEIFRSTESKNTDYAVVPVENSTEGRVSSTLDRLINTSLSICGEINLKIHQNLLGNTSDFSAIDLIYAHRQSIGQCKHWLDMHFPNVKLVPVSSNAEAAKKASEEIHSSAIASAESAKIYQLKILAKNIEDEPGNTTRFLILSDRETPPSGDDKTSLLFSCRHHPGALFHLLKPLFDERVDMTKIESLPSKTGLWEYVFFVDIKGHIDNRDVANALRQIQSQAVLFKILGSYPTSI